MIFGAVLKEKLLRTTVSVQVAETFAWLKCLFTAQPFWGRDERRCEVGGFSGRGAGTVARGETCEAEQSR